MPTPNLYSETQKDTFAQVVPALQSAEVPLFFVTDRAPEADEAGKLSYGSGRSSSLAFGRASVALGRAARIHFLEYRPTGDIQGKSDTSLHSKVSVLGPDLIIGSANADVRSFMMDSNNAMFIGNAPELQAQYLAWLDGILADKERTVELTGQMRNVSLEEMLREDRATLRALLEHKLSGHIDGEIPAGPVLDELENTLANIYELSVKALAERSENTKANKRGTTHS